MRKFTFILVLIFTVSVYATEDTGKEIYKQTCIACHGPNGQGTIPGVPKLSDRLSKSDEALLNSITNGFQSEGSPMAMPAKGGNASLTDADTKEVLSYIRQSFGQ